MRPHHGVGQAPGLKYVHHVGLPLANARGWGSRLRAVLKLTCTAAAVLCGRWRSTVRDRPLRQGQSVGNAHLCAAAVRRAGRRLRLGAGRIRDRTDGARHLALRPAALARGAPGADLLGDRADLDAAVDVEEFRPVAGPAVPDRGPDRRAARHHADRLRRSKSVQAERRRADPDLRPLSISTRGPSP